MSEPMEWLPDGTPARPHVGGHDPCESGMDRARAVFLAGCDLPAAWADQPRWTVLETGFGGGLNFLATWAAWKADARRPRQLHFVSVDASPLHAADLVHALAVDPALQPLADQLHAQCWGLTPGVHRLGFEQGQVLLTLYIGDAQQQLRQQACTADSIYLNDPDPDPPPSAELWGLDTMKALARHSRRGTGLAASSMPAAVRDHLAQCGFVLRQLAGVQPPRGHLQAVFDPAWQPRQREGSSAAAPPAAVAQAGQALVVGSGLAGAAAAHSLALRGWQVTVLDAGETPAAGASGLPGGLFFPHVSPDDAPLSRLSRAGLRLTLQRLHVLVQEGVDWAPTGVLEHCVDGRLRLPDAHALGWAAGTGSDWSRPATAEQLAAAGLPPDTIACWHAAGGWLQPARLVAALLRHPAIHWQGASAVARLQPQLDTSGLPRWQALDAHGRVLATADLAVVAAGPHSAALLASATAQDWPLNAIRGQVSLGTADEAHPPQALPPFPVNGNGNLVPRIPQASNSPLQWVMGSTFERERTELPISAADQTAAQAHNLGKLRTLLPATAAALEAAFDPARPTWGRVRCTVADRLPVVGPVPGAPGLWLITAMGARGLTLSQLCGELLAARVHGEPLPLETRLAEKLDSGRFQKTEQLARKK